MRRGRYPLKLKENLVSRFLQDPDAQIGEFSRENGVSESCLREWIRQSENGTLGVMTSRKYPKLWTLAEKYEALQKFDTMSELEQGKWLRSHGLSSQKLETWKQEIAEGLKGLSAGPKKTENKTIKALEKDLERKNKALAEASAILFAKKKLDAIFGEGDEEN